MTRDEALELLRRGGDDAVAIWNSWRGITWVRGHPQYAKDGPLLPRLNDANLAGVDLRGIDLTDADLSWTDLRGAKLQGSSFFGARLAYTDLREADFTNCQLGNANFLWTKLHKANLAGCSLRKTVFCCDLSAAHGLNNLTYFGSSIMSIECIRYFTKEFPQRLLMGCGFTDDEIAFLRSVAPLPAEYHSCFISHSSRPIPSSGSGFTATCRREVYARGTRRTIFRLVRGFAWTLMKPSSPIRNSSLSSQCTLYSAPGLRRKSKPHSSRSEFRACPFCFRYGLMTPL